MTRLVGLFFFGMAAFFMYLGANEVMKQEKAIQSYVPITVKVLDKTVQGHTSSKGSASYKPIVHYSYKIGDVIYSSDRVMPMSVSRSDRGWAENLITGFTPGNYYRGYYDPAQPSQAFLIKRHSFFPYVFVLFPILHFEIGLALMLCFMPSTSAVYLPSKLNPGWSEVKPDISCKKNLINIALIASTWDAISFGVLGHYAYKAEQPFSVYFYVALLLYSLVGFFLTRKTLALWSASNCIGEPTVLVDATNCTPGTPFQVQVVLKPLRDANITSAIITIQCKRTGRSSSSSGPTTATLFTRNFNFAENHKIKAGHSETLEQSILIPADAAGENVFSLMVKWKMVLKIKLDDGGEMSVDYPIRIDDMMPNMAPGDIIQILKEARFRKKESS